MKNLSFYALAAALVVFAVIFFSSCGGSERASLAQPASSPGLVTPLNTTWPSLPADKAQPWEKLDGAGRVVSSINLQSQFIPGVERFVNSAGVSDLGEASTFVSGSPGAENVSWAIYRIPMGSDQPGTIAADVNLRLNSAYYIGVGDYSVNTWHWYGPFGVSHIRFNVPFAAYTSALGNLMLAVVAYDGADFDLVGLGVNARDVADTTAPPVPSSPTLTPEAGGVLAEWIPVVEGDLAGYRIYANGNNAFDYIEGGTSTFIPAFGDVEVTISAVDVSGNESALSGPATATPLTGTVPAVQLTASSPSGIRGDIIALTATGADSYDWDTNGDGTWDITADTTGSAFAVTTDLGIIRPALRAHSAGDGFWMGAVSLIIAGNSRPVITAVVNISSGVAPLDVEFNFYAEDDDGTIADYAWDFDGDGSYDGSFPVNMSPLPHTYNTPGLYNAKFRATDNEGAWDVDTVAVLVSEEDGPPVAYLIANPYDALMDVGQDAYGSISFSADQSYTPLTSPLIYEFNPLGSGDSGWINNFNSPYYPHNYRNPGVYQAQVRVTDAKGRWDIATQEVRIYRFASTNASPRNGNNLGSNNSLCLYMGKPFVAYHDETLSTIYGALAQDAAGRSWSPQQNLDAIAMGDHSGGNGTSCAGLLDSGIGIAFINSTDNYSLMYTYYSSSGSMMTTTVQPGWTWDYFTNPSLQNVSGLPAMTYRYDDALGGDYVFYMRARNLQGTAWDQFYLNELTSLTSSLANSPDGPAAAYAGPGYLYFHKSADPLGNSWNAPTKVVGSANYLESVSLSWLDGYYGIAYLDMTAGMLYFVRSTDATGTAWEPPIVIDAIASNSCSLAKCSRTNLAGIAYIGENGRVMYAQSYDPDSRSWAQRFVVHQGVADVCSDVNLVNVDGLPGISYYNQTSWSCDFAYPRIY